jgi:hypothetical protein
VKDLYPRIEAKPQKARSGGDAYNREKTKAERNKEQTNRAQQNTSNQNPPPLFFCTVHLSTSKFEKQESINNLSREKNIANRDGRHQRFECSLNRTVFGTERRGIKLREKLSFVQVFAHLQPFRNRRLKKPITRCGGALKPGHTGGKS